MGRSNKNLHPWQRRDWQKCKAIKYSPQDSISLIAFSPIGKHQTVFPQLTIRRFTAVPIVSPAMSRWYVVVGRCGSRDRPIDEEVQDRQHHDWHNAWEIIFGCNEDDCRTIWHRTIWHQDNKADNLIKLNLIEHFWQHIGQKFSFGVIVCPLGHKYG